MSTRFSMFVMYIALVGIPIQMLRIGCWVVKYLFRNENNDWADSRNAWANAMIVLSIVLCYCGLPPFAFIMGILDFGIYIILRY